ncbi:hypothetical protein AAT19DRAFT_11388, partial [Rhodotorula toruloides]
MTAWGYLAFISFKSVSPGRAVWLAPDCHKEPWMRRAVSSTHTHHLLTALDTLCTVFLVGQSALTSSPWCIIYGPLYVWTPVCMSAEWLL